MNETNKAGFEVKNASYWRRQAGLNEFNKKETWNDGYYTGRAEIISQLSGIVTTDGETKDQFIHRIRGLINAINE